jgi:hypothetical protein
VLIHVLLFTFGNQAAIAGAAVVTLFMLTMPFGWAVLVRHHGRAEGEPEQRPGNHRPTGIQPH